MPPRLHVDLPLHRGASLALPEGAARHVQVLRLQPGALITLFNGEGGEWSATVTRIGRAEVTVDIGLHQPVERELAVQVTLALGMPANERMDALVEKATELGVAAIQPLVCARSVLRLAGDRAAKRVAHWRAVAVAACEQSGRNRVPVMHAIRPLGEWLAGLGPPGLPGSRVVLSPRPLGDVPGEPPASGVGQIVCLSGPEGGLDEAEEAAALRHAFLPLSLGPRILRADTAPLALLAGLAWQGRSE